MCDIAIITGATGGIGKVFVEYALRYELAEIWAIARNGQRLSALREEYGERIVPIPADLSTLEGIETVQALLRERKPLVKYLVNNAGIGKMGAYHEFSQEEIIRTIDVNCKAPVLLCHICIPYMASGSRILNIASAAAFQPNPYLNLYAASKAFERNYSRALHVELEGNGITVTAVCPGWVDTGLLVREINGKPVRFPGMVTAERVVKRAFYDADRGRDMSICSLYGRLQHLNVKWMPQRLTMKLWMRGIHAYGYGQPVK